MAVGRNSAINSEGVRLESQMLSGKQMRAFAMWHSRNYTGYTYAFDLEGFFHHPRVDIDWKIFKAGIDYQASVMTAK